MRVRDFLHPDCRHHTFGDRKHLSHIFLPTQSLKESGLSGGRRDPTAEMCLRHPMRIAYYKEE